MATNLFQLTAAFNGDEVSECCVLSSQNTLDDMLILI